MESKTLDGPAQMHRVVDACVIESVATLFKLFAPNLRPRFCCCIPNIKSNKQIKTKYAKHIFTIPFITNEPVMNYIKKLECSEQYTLMAFDQEH